MCRCASGVEVVRDSRGLTAHTIVCELRRKYKDETTRLNQALKSASVGSKATDKQADRLQKDIDKLR